MIEDSIAKTRVEAFHRRHGGECYSDESKFYYPDGAYRDVNPLGVLAEPRDPRAKEGAHRNAENVVLFHRLKLKHAVAKFDELNFRLSTALPAQPRKALAELERLQAVVDQCKKEHDAAVEKLDSTEIGRFRKEMKKGAEDERRRFHEFQRKRAAIRV